METISIFEYVIFALAAISAICLLATAVGRHLSRQTLPVEEGEERRLVEFRHRESLTMLLQLNRITGDADIRGGEVFPTADPEKASVFSRMLMGAYSQAKANGMTSGSNVYFAVKNPGQGTGWNYHCFGDFGIGDAAAVANILDRQAALISELRFENANLKKEQAQ